MQGKGLSGDDQSHGFPRDGRGERVCVCGRGMYEREIERDFII